METPVSPGAITGLVNKQAETSLDENFDLEEEENENELMEMQTQLSLK